ncbi:MAG: hypothetical protein GU359_05725 [Desulfurococcales archaeon]|nr:hypothetical protein [Desulfurococcales archaeon]
MRTFLYLLMLTLSLTIIHQMIILAYSGDNLSEIDSLVSSIMKDLEYLESREVNVSSLIQRVNEDIKGLEKDPGNATYIKDLESIRDEIKALKSDAENIYIINNIIRYSTAVGIGLVPVAVYILLPRIYLYIWYRTRRRWIVQVRK